MGKSRNLANLASNVEPSGAITAAGISTEVSLGVDTYDSLGQLPIRGLSNGDQAFVGNRLYISNGFGWYNVGLVNLAPSIIDRASDSSPYELDSSNTLSLSLTANDSDGTPIIWSFSASDSASSLATITNDSDGSFNVTGKSLADILAAGYDSAGGSFSITFTASDGISFDTDSASFTLTYSVVSAFDVSTASYDNVNFYVGNEEVTPWGMAFNDDGTKMYVTGNNDRVYQYTLATGFDVSTASYDNVDFYVGNEDNEPKSIAFNNDGTKMYMAGSGLSSTGSPQLQDRVYQYTLATGFNIATASYDNVNFFFGNEEDEALGIAFNDDGTKMYVIGSNRRVYQYTLSTGFNVATASYDNVDFYVGDENSYPQNVNFNNDGTKMYITGWSVDAVDQYTLATGFDVSTASYDNVNFYVGDEASSASDMAFNNDGTKMYVIDRTSDNVYQYTLG